jgi:hypothetical protein
VYLCRYLSTNTLWTDYSIKFHEKDPYQKGVDSKDTESRKLNGPQGYWYSESVQWTAYSHVYFKK